MNILFVCPYTPTAIRTRSYHLLTTLLQRGHAVTLGTVWQTEADRDQLRALQQLGLTVLASRLTRSRSLVNLLPAALSGRPLQARFCWVPALARQLQHNVQARSPRFDVMHVEHLRAVEYGLAVRGLPNAGQPLPILWDSVDCISMLFEQAVRHSRTGFGRWATRLELPATRRYEGWAVGQFDQVLVTSKVDQAALERLAVAHPPARPIRVLPNGVDLIGLRPPEGPREPATIVLTGKMSYHANVTAAHHLIRDIMPLVWAADPSVKVRLVGSTPSPDIRALGDRYGSRVIVTGHVPDMRPHLQAATLAVAPMAYGAGIQNKVLEAMACGTPVVASPPAVAALPESVKQAVLIAADAPSTAAAILAILRDPALQSSLGQRGRAFVGEYYDWSTVTAELETIYDELPRLSDWTAWLSIL